MSRAQYENDSVIIQDALRWRADLAEYFHRLYDNVADAKANLATYLRFYNERRPHRSLEGKTPDVAYFVALASATPGAA